MLPLSGSIAVLLNQDTGGGGGSPSPQPPAQPQQPPALEVPDPFKDIDLDLLPDEARAAVEKSRAEIARLAKSASQASEFQSKADRLAHALAVQQDQMQKLQAPAQPAPPKETSMEEDLYTNFVNEGMPANIAKVQAKAQATVMEKYLEKAQSKVAEHFMPYVNQTLTHSTQAAFAQIASEPFAQDPEVVAQLEAAAGQMLEQGQQPSVEILKNLGAMFHYRKLQAAPPPVQQQQQQPQPVAQPPRQFSFMTIPAGGAVPVVQKPPVDPAVAAAMASVNNRWKSIFGLKK